MEKNRFVGYEYLKIPVRRSMAPVYADGYENFGWELEGTEEQPGKLALDTVSMKFKRDRRLSNKAELIRLQRNFDACVSEILSLEASKRIRASAAAYTVAIAGTVFMACSVFAVTAGNPVLCMILAIPALIGWIVPYFLYNALEKKKTAQVMPLIDQMYDELYTVCEKAYGLLDGGEE